MGYDPVTKLQSTCSTASPCAVTNPSNLVYYSPDRSGASATPGAAYGSFQFAVSNSIGLFSQPAVFTLSVRPRPVLPVELPRRYFFSQASPLSRPGLTPVTT